MEKGLTVLFISLQFPYCNVGIVSSVSYCSCVVIHRTTQFMYHDTIHDTICVSRPKMTSGLPNTAITMQHRCWVLCGFWFFFLAFSAPMLPSMTTRSARQEAATSFWRCLHSRKWSSGKEGQSHLDFVLGLGFKQVFPVSTHSWRKGFRAQFWFNWSSWGVLSQCKGSRKELYWTRFCRGTLPLLSQSGHWEACAIQG